MDPLDLFVSTGNPQVDETLRGTIGILETLFPGRIKAYYLHGSFADGTGIETSDIDLFLVAKEALTAEEHEKLRRIMHFSSLFSAFMVEMMALDEPSLRRSGHYRVKSASQLLWGQDIRADMPEQTLEQYLRMYARFPFIYLAQMLRGIETMTAPLTYPQPAGEFYGYDQALLPPKNEPRHNIKKLVTEVCWTATVLIAWHAGKMVSGKRASVQLYREYVHDEWTPFITEIYERGNRQWRYLVPDKPEARQQLRELCVRTLEFERHYLRRYQRYLQAELQKHDEYTDAAAQQLQRLFL